MSAATAFDAIVTLQRNLSRLSEKDQAFAQSLLSARTLSGKQHHWIGILAERATRVAAAPAVVGDIQPIVAMINLAKSKLRWPAILLGDPASPLRVTVAGDKAREPGSLTLTSGSTERDADGRRAWFGRVSLDGTFQPARDLPKVEADAIHALLVAFASDPQGESRRFARRSGRCCFCGQRLEDRDQISTVLGWGPVCARNWGLPHNKAAAAAVLAADAPEVPAQDDDYPGEDSPALRALEAENPMDDFNYVGSRWHY